MSWDRTDRLEAILREKIAAIVLDHVADPTLGFVTIVRVELSRDKRAAKVFYTCLGTEGQRRTTHRALQRAAPFVQERMAPRLKMRNTPILRFEYDGAVEKETRMRALLEGLAAERALEEQDGAEEPEQAAPDTQPGEEPAAGLDSSEPPPDDDESPS